MAFLQVPATQEPGVGLDGNRKESGSARIHKLSDLRKASRKEVVQYAGHTIFDMARKLVAEFIGTLFLVFVITFSSQSEPQPLSAALVSGLAVAAIVASLAHISGAHVNPAITIGLLVAGEIEPIMAALYVGVQIAGGIVGAMCMRGSLNLRTYLMASGGCNLINKEFTTTEQAFISEFVQAFFLMLAVMGTAVDPRSTNRVVAPLAIGFVVANGIGVAGKSSSGGMNPARSFAASAVYSMFAKDNSTLCAGELCLDRLEVWEDHYVFWVAPIAACILCALMFRLLFMDASTWRWWRRSKKAARKVSRMVMSDHHFHTSQH